MVLSIASRTVWMSALVVALLCSSVSVCAKPRVLLVVTNVGSWTPTTWGKGDPRGPSSIGKPKPTGFWLAEFTHSYTIFNTSGWDIDVGSPKGGEGVVDPQGFAFYANDPLSTPFFKKRADGSLYIEQVQDTIPLASIKEPAKRYDALFLVGGTGAMWDFPYDKNIQRIAVELYLANKIVSAVCHGPMGLVNAKLPSGKWLVEGRLVTGFSNDEEQLLGKANVCALCGYEPGCDPKTCDGPYMPAEYPKAGSFLLEEGLKNHSAIYVAPRQDWVTFYYRPHVIKDGLLVTGQNPGAAFETSSAVVATYNLLKKRGLSAAKAQLQSIFCSPIQQKATDPPVICQVRDYKHQTGYTIPSVDLRTKS